MVLQGCTFNLWSAQKSFHESTSNRSLVKQLLPQTQFTKCSTVETKIKQNLINKWKMEVYSVKDTEHGISLSFFSQKFTVETAAVLKKHKESTEARDIFAWRHTLPESVERAAASVSALPGVVETGVQVRTASGGEDGGGGLLRLHKLNLHISKTEKNSLNPVSNNRSNSGVC